MAIKGKLLAAETSIVSPSSFDSESSFESPRGTKADRTLKMDLVAQEQINQNEYDAAIKTLTSILAIRRERLTRRQRKDKRTSNLREKSEVARTLGTFATVLRKKGESKQALMLYSEARRLLLANGIPEHSEVIVNLDKDMEEWRSGDLVDL